MSITKSWKCVGGLFLKIENSRDVIYPVNLHGLLKPVIDGNYPTELLEIPPYLKTGLFLDTRSVFRSF